MEGKKKALECLGKIKFEGKLDLLEGIISGINYMQSGGGRGGERRVLTIITTGKPVLGVTGEREEEEIYVAAFVLGSCSPRTPICFCRRLDSDLYERHEVPFATAAFQNS